MSVSIVVPFRSDAGDRDRAWAYLKSRYQHLYPNWQIVESDCDGAWSKGRAVRNALEATPASSAEDVLIISDADVVMRDDILPTAVEHLKLGPWVVPHGMVYRINKQASEELYAGGPCLNPTWSAQLDEPVKRRTPGGGICVIPRETYERVPIDDRFEQWGGEDMAWGWALEILVGHGVYLNRPMWHLYHPRAYVETVPLGGRGSEKTEALLLEYQEAAEQARQGDPEPIKRLARV